MGREMRHSDEIGLCQVVDAGVVQEMKEAAHRNVVFIATGNMPSHAITTSGSRPGWDRIYPAIACAPSATLHRRQTRSKPFHERPNRQMGSSRPGWVDQGRA